MPSAYLHCKYMKDCIRIMARMPIDKYFSGFPTSFQLDFEIIHPLPFGYHPGFDCRQGQGFFFSKKSRPALGTHPATYSRDTEDYFTGSKEAGA
jgi:hypothetical protein